MPARGTATNRQPASNRQVAVGRRTASGRQNVDGSGGGGGGSSLIDSSGSTLGAVPAINTTKQLTADNQVYFSDGINWRPFYNPGFIRYDGANDEEWEGANADPPSGWSYDNQSTATVDVNNVSKSELRMTASNTVSNRGAFLYKSAPASPSNKTYYAQIALENVGSDASYGGIFVRNNSNGRLFSIAIGPSSGNGTLFGVVVQKNTNSSTFSANALATSQLSFGVNTSVVLAMVNDGTNITFKWGPFFGGKQTDLFTVYSEAIATFIGSWDQIGYFLQAGGTGGMTLISDWFRIQASL